MFSDEEFSNTRLQMLLFNHVLDEEPVLATDAVRLVDENVDNDAAVLLLGHPLKIKAERK